MAQNQVYSCLCKYLSHAFLTPKYFLCISHECRCEFLLSDVLLSSRIVENVVSLDRFDFQTAACILRRVRILLEQVLLHSGPVALVFEGAESREYVVIQRRQTGQI